MAKLDPKLPASAKVLFSYDLDDRDQDLFNVGLPGGVQIDVGWYPAWNRRGQFMVLVVRDSFDHKVEPPFRSRDVDEIRRHVEDVARKYGV